MKDWKTTKQLTLVNLKNDLTPCENIAMVYSFITVLNLKYLDSLRNGQGSCNFGPCGVP